MTVSCTRTVGGVLVTAVVAPGQEPLADDVFSLLERLTPLQPGMRIRFGWSMLTLTAHDEGLIVCEPDFDRNPMRDVRPRLDLTLDVIVRQARLLRSVGAEPTEVAYDEFCVFEREVLSARLIHLHRDPKTAPDDSGWRISALTEKRASAPEFQARRMFSIVPRRSDLLAILTLPMGFCILVEEGEVQLVVDNQGRKLLG